MDSRSSGGVPTAALSRRRLLQVGLGLSGLALGEPLLSACAKTADAATGGGRSLKIGFVSPVTGPAAGFGESDAYVLALARKAFAGGLVVNGQKYDVQIIDKDGQSDPQRASQVANDLINGAGVDLMLATSSAEVVNPVADACEAAGVPCVTTVSPWESWVLGRGGKLADKEPFKYTFHFCFGVEEFRRTYAAMWKQVSTNKKVGTLLPNDSTGNAIRATLGPLLTQDGYTVVDAGPYTDGTNDYSSQIARFKTEGCEIFNTFPIPPDFATFWQQAAQQGYRPKIVQVAKTGLFASQVEALGPLGPGIAGAAYWTPTFPYSSPLTKVSSKDLAEGYQNGTGRQWSQQLGPSLALFDVAAAAFQAAADPRDKTGVAAALAKLDVQTTVGRLRWGTGPNKNVVATPLFGGQWVSAPAGSRYPLDFVLCDNTLDPNVPVAATLKPYGA